MFCFFRHLWVSAVVSVFLCGAVGVADSGSPRPFYAPQFRLIQPARGFRDESDPCNFNLGRIEAAATYADDLVLVLRQRLNNPRIPQYAVTILREGAEPTVYTLVHRIERLLRPEKPIPGLDGGQLWLAATFVVSAFGQHFDLLAHEGRAFWSYVREGIYRAEMQRLGAEDQYELTSPVRQRLLEWCAGDDRAVPDELARAVMADPFVGGRIIDLTAAREHLHYMHYSFSNRIRMNVMPVEFYLELALTGLR